LIIAFEKYTENQI